MSTSHWKGTERELKSLLEALVLVMAWLVVLMAANFAALSWLVSKP